MCRRSPFVSVASIRPRTAGACGPTALLRCLKWKQIGHMRGRCSPRGSASVPFVTGQERVVEALLAGRSALAVFPTGGGQEPLLPAAGAAARRRHGRRLAADRADEGPDRLRSRGCGVAAARLDSSLDADEVRDVSARLRAGSAQAPLRRPGAVQQRALPGAARRTTDRALRGRRGALHLRVGAQLPARLPQARRARARARRRARAGADGDRDAGRRRRHLRRLRDRRGRRGRDGLLPAEPDAADDAGRGAASGTQLLVDRLRERPPGSTIVYVTLQRTAVRVADAARRGRAAGARRTTRA